MQTIHWFTRYFIITVEEFNKFLTIEYELAIFIAYSLTIEIDSEYVLEYVLIVVTEISEEKTKEHYSIDKQLLNLFKQPVLISISNYS